MPNSCYQTSDYEVHIDDLLVTGDNTWAGCIMLEVVFLIYTLYYTNLGGVLPRTGAVALRN